MNVHSKHLKALLILFTLIIFISSANILNVCAKDERDCALCGETHDWDEIKNPLNTWIYSMECRVYGGDIIPDGVMTILKFDLNSPDNGFSEMNTLINNAYGFFSKLGMLVMAVYVFYDLFGKVATEQLSGETLFLALIRLLVGMVVINSGKDILFYGIQVTNEIFDAVSKTGITQAADPFKKTTCKFHKYTQDRYVWRALLDGSFIFIPWLISFITGLVISISCWSRLLDITVRVIFAPIGMADMVTEGTNSSGWGYFKKLLASILKGAVLLMTLKSYGIISSMTRDMNTFFAWMMPILLSLVVIGMIFKTASIADDIVGA